MPLVIEVRSEKAWLYEHVVPICILRCGKIQHIG